MNNNREFLICADCDATALTEYGTPCQCGGSYKFIQRLRPCAFVSRHKPTRDQRNLAEAQGLALVEVGDLDAFNDNLAECLPEFDTVCVVHAAAAITLLASGKEVVVFQNGNRAPEGEKPSFEAVKIHRYVSANGPFPLI